MLSFLLSSVVLIGSAGANYFPPKPEGITVLESKFHPNVTISYKETFICETTPGVKGFSGYIHLPANGDGHQSYDINTFFWFFESRNDPANSPLALWLQGGPGAPSIPAALGENGPCIVTRDSKDTVLNPWSWNNNANMLYIDQPVQTGFSYDTLVNGTINQIHSPLDITVKDFSISEVPAVNETYLHGTFPSTNPRSTANLTTTAAFSAWQFMQTWTQEFPEYKPKDNKISIWSESYGGHYGPTFANFFEEQNDKITNGELKAPASKIYLDTVGIGNGCVDIETQIQAYPHMAHNNTYGLELMTDAEYQSALDSYPKCQSLIESCRSAQASSPLSETTSKACSAAFDFCFKNMWDAYNKHGRNVFDIELPLISSWAPKFAAGYLNRADTQLALGVPLNFTGMSTGVAKAFDVTGDFSRAGNLQALGSLLDRGVKVALMYGDKDYQCNWLGGENVSLHIPSALNAGFRNAGYASLETNSTYSGGFVRQHGNLSFTRVFNAGHEVPWSQPETAYRIFTRAMLGTDIATGTVPTGGAEGYSTEGPQSVFSIKKQVAEVRERVCYLWDVMETCTEEEVSVLLSGSAIIKDFILVGQSATSVPSNTSSGNYALPTVAFGSASTSAALSPATLVPSNTSSGNYTLPTVAFGPASASAALSPTMLFSLLGLTLWQILL